MDYRSQLNEGQETIYLNVMLNPMNRARLSMAYGTDSDLFIHISSELIQEVSSDISPVDMCWIQFAMIDEFSKIARTVE